MFFNILRNTCAFNLKFILFYFILCHDCIFFFIYMFFLIIILIIISLLCLLMTFTVDKML